MAIKTISVWDGVPDAERLKAKLKEARNEALPAMQRTEALSYLSGAAKVLAGIEKRAALADYLRGQIKRLKVRLHYGDSHDAHHQH